MCSRWQTISAGASKGSTAAFGQRVARLSSGPEVAALEAAAPEALTLDAFTTLIRTEAQ